MTESNRSRRDLIQTAAGLTVATPLAGCNVDVRRTEAEDTPAPTPEERTDTPTDTPEPTPEEETDTPEPSEENSIAYIGDRPGHLGAAFEQGTPLRTVHELRKERIANEREYINDTRDRLDPDDYNPNNELSLEDLMQDALDISRRTYPREEKGKDQSGYTSELAGMIGDFAKQNYGKDYEATGDGGDGHGWAYLWMEGIPPKIIDINAGVGDIGENHLSKENPSEPEPPGTDKIGKFLDGEEWRVKQVKGDLLNMFSYSGVNPEDHNGTMIADDAVRPIYEQIMEDPELARTMVRPAMAAAWGAHINNEDGIYMITDPDLPVFDPKLNTTQYSTKGVETGKLEKVNKDFREHYQELMENDIVESMSVEEAKKHL